MVVVEEEVVPLPNIPTTWYGWLAFVLLGTATFILNWRKGKVDESTKILGEWRKLYDAHEARIAVYEKRIDAHERRIEALTKENTSLQSRLRGAEERILHLEEVVIEKDKRIAGLEATIRQNSQSVAYQIGRQSGVSSEEDADAVEKLNRAGDNSLGRGGRK